MKTKLMTSLALLGVASSLFIAVPSVAYASESNPEEDWVKVAPHGGDACPALTEAFEVDKIPVPTSCEFSDAIFPTVDLSRSEGIFSSYALSPMTWSGTNTVVRSSTSPVRQAYGGFLPVCVAPGTVRSAGLPYGVDQYIPTDGLSATNPAITPKWEECYLNERPAAALWTQLQLPVDSQVHGSYAPISSSASPIYHATLTEMGTLFFSYGSDGAPILHLDSTRETIERLWGADFSKYFFDESSPWCDPQTITGGTTTETQNNLRLCYRTNAIALYGVDNIIAGTPSPYFFHGRGWQDPESTYQNSTHMSNNFGFFSASPGLDSVAQQGDCVVRAGIQSLCMYEVRTASLASFQYRSYTSGFLKTTSTGVWNPSSYTEALGYPDTLMTATVDPASVVVEFEARLTWTLVVPSDVSLSGPIVESERELGIDPDAIEAAGGCIDWSCPTDEWLGNFPAFQAPDCSDGDILKCITGYIDAFFVWLGDFIGWLIEVIIPPDLDFLAWISAVWQGFIVSDAYFYSYGTHSTVQSALASIEECTAISAPISGSQLELDFCGFQNNTMTNVFRIVIILLGGWVMIGTLYRFFAPKSSIAAAVAPKTAAAVEDRS